MGIEKSLETDLFLRGSIAQTHSDLSIASNFKLLREVIAELHDRKPHAVTASHVRLRLDEVSSGTFTPQATGQRSFRDFLREAERRSIVALIDRPGDCLVVPYETVDRARKPRVRSDLWKAVVDWNFDDYVWDLSLGSVTRSSRESIGNGKSGGGPTSPNQIPIPKLGEEEQLALLEDFVRGLDLDPPTKQTMLETLATERRISATVDRIKSLGENLARDWTLVVREEVRALVQSWKASDSRLQDVEVFESAPQLFSSHSVKEVDIAGSATSVLRKKVHEAIDRMSEEQLRQLPLPAGVLLPES